ncbi:Gp49 family protein [Priestia megaterium]|uniref:Gp49 family protein n=1 Tax=Priestia megaterium TaxID=1404 RepID=UPI000BFB462F|nr:Gp49 family protein [Priestia megaterium]PGO60689.1 hypothetical protein CN981_09060 [Priestia megaterium]
MTELKLNEYQQKLYDENVVHSWTTKIGRKTTVVTLSLKNGFEVTGVTGCVNPKDYDFNIGYHYALVDALSQADGFIGYARQEELHKQQQAMQMTSNWHDVGFIKDSTFDVGCNLGALNVGKMAESSIKVTDQEIKVRGVSAGEVFTASPSGKVVARGMTTVNQNELKLPLRQVNRKGDFASSIINKLQAGGN